MTSYWLEYAWIGEAVQQGVRVEVVDGRFQSVAHDTQPSSSDSRLNGLSLPGFANTHSHAFHRALRSRTQADRGSFWTWRDVMYRAAERLTPDSYHRLARATFAEMALSGMTAVGEFHYLHHQPDGTRYADANVMGEAVLAAASEAGIRITLLDTLYLHGGLAADGYQPVTGAQVRYCDHSVDRWAERVASLTVGQGQRVGAAVHSVRAVDPTAMTQLASFAAEQSMPVHAHVSEQRLENDACEAHHGCSPTALLETTGVLSQRFTSIHATHLSDNDIDAYERCRCGVCFCPTTERDLGDGIGPSRELVRRGIALSLGSDSHAVIDAFEESRALELNERLQSTERGIHDAPSLLRAASRNGHEALGFDDAGDISTGSRADLVTIGLDSVRLAGVGTGTLAEAAVFAATASDVDHVLVDGRPVVTAGRHVGIDVAAELDASISELLEA